MFFFLFPLETSFIMNIKSYFMSCGKQVWSSYSKTFSTTQFAPSAYSRHTYNFSIGSLSSLSIQKNANRQYSKSSLTSTNSGVFFQSLHNHTVPSLSYSPVPQLTLSPLFMSVRHYQSVLRPRLHCKGCYYVWRHGRKFVECSDIPSHKQMKKLPTRKVWLEDYSRGDVNVAMKWNRDLKRIAHRNVDRTAISHNWLASRIGKDIWIQITSARLFIQAFMLFFSSLIKHTFNEIELSISIWYLNFMNNYRLESYWHLGSTSWQMALYNNVSCRFATPGYQYVNKWTLMLILISLCLFQ